VRDPVLQLYNTQRSIGEAAAEIDAAYLLAKDNDDKLMNGLPNKEADIVAIRRNFTLASRLAMRGVDRLFEASGARGILDSNPIQRFWRDIHAAGNHVAWGVDTGYVNAGAFAMGVPAPGGAH
jgi:3-hydroxy-9,10-secoandrosta-1,3,5(10)-triene-9,17-dione monooxygenase